MHSLSDKHGSSPQSASENGSKSSAGVLGASMESPLCFVLWLELGPQQNIYIYIYIVCLASGKQRDPKKAKNIKGELILGKLHNWQVLQFHRLLVGARSVGHLLGGSFLQFLPVKHPHAGAPLEGSLFARPGLHLLLIYQRDVFRKPKGQHIECE